MNKENGNKFKVMLLLIVWFQIIITMRYLTNSLEYEEYRNIQFSLIALLMPSPLEEKNDK